MALEKNGFTAKQVDIPIPFGSYGYVLRYRYEREAAYIQSIRYGKEKSFRDLPGT